jgi:catechol 2,3-dioxygenase-like lactoylglutathione lyase family enzyme
MLETLDHVVIAVRDLEAATESYSRLLGRRPSWRGVHPQYGTANTLFRLENTYVELLGVRGSGTLSQLVTERLEGKGEGLFALAFGTKDAAGFAAAVRARGLDAADPADGSGKDERTGAERRWRNVFLPEAETRGVMLFAIEHRSAPELLPVTEPIGAPEGAISGIDHVVVQTPNPDASKALYGDKLGIRLALDKTFPQWGARLLFFRVGGITVEIAAELAAADASASDRLWGISYRVPDVERTRERMLAEGFDVSEVRVGRRPATHVATVRGEPLGVATLLISLDPA